MSITTGVLLIVLTINGNAANGRHQFCATNTVTNVTTCSKAARSVALTLKTGRYRVAVDNISAGSADIEKNRQTTVTVRRTSN